MEEDLVDQDWWRRAAPLTSSRIQMCASTGALCRSVPWRRSDQDSGLRATRTAAAPHATCRPCFLRGNERHAATTRRIHLVARLLQSMSGCNGCRRPPHACQHELTSPSVEDPDASPKKPTATHDRSTGQCSLTSTTPSLHVRMYLHEACYTGRRPIVA